MPETTWSLYESFRAAHDPETAVFFQLGDFYEVYESDALLMSSRLGLVMDSRPFMLSEMERVHKLMCGVPVCSSHRYFEALDRQGVSYVVYGHAENSNSVYGRPVRRELRNVRPIAIIEAPAYDRAGCPIR